jgi:hypothetical protein
MVPEPLAPEELVNDAGLPPLQMVWLEPMDPDVSVPNTVTVTAEVAPDSQATLFCLDMVILLY